MTSFPPFLKKQKVSGWASRKHKVQSFVCKPKSIEELITVITYASNHNLKVIPCGGRYSYGDLVTNKDGIIIDLKDWDKIISEDFEHGKISVQPGVRITQILDRAITKGWMLKGIPGGAHVTVGGAVGNNVHGKDDYSYGAFGKNVLEMKVLFADGSIKRINKDSDSELFLALIGGLGLLGIIVEITLQLERLEGQLLEVTRKKYHTLEELKSLMDANCDNCDMIFAWLDAFSSQGRGIFEMATWKKGTEYKPKEPMDTKPQRLFGIFPVPLVYPFIRLINCSFFMRLYNQLKMKFDKDSSVTVENFCDYYYPSAFQIPDYAGLFPGGMFEFQVVFPIDAAVKNFKELFKICQKFGIYSWMSIVKRLKSDNYLLSFPKDGLTMCFDIPARGNNRNHFKRFVREFNDYVGNHGGKLNFSKDMLMSKEYLKAMYPNIDDVMRIKKTVDPKNTFQNDLFKRLFV